MSTESMSDRPPAPTIRVLVVDDQPLIRRGLALALDSEPGFSVVGQAADGEEALELVRRHAPDVVLMDLKMPRMGGVAATRAIGGEFPRVQVVVLTTYDSDDLVFDAIRAGAQAYLLKDASEHELLETIRAVQRGESRLQPQIARKVMEELRRTRSPASAGRAPQSGERGGDEVAADEGLDPASAAITPREEEVLELISQGHSNKEIARALALAEGTIKNHVSRIMEKLHVRSRTELAVKAMRRRGG